MSFDIQAFGQAVYEIGNPNVKPARGTSDFMFVFNNNSQMKMAANVDHVNEWLGVNAERVKYMHVGETLTIFRKGRAIMRHRATREQFIESLEGLV
jgi:hypothetical protein